MASNLNHYDDSINHGGAGNSNSPGGSLGKHKMDLAQFLLQKYDKEQEELGMK